MAEDLRVLVLGPVEIERDGEVVSIGGPRARSVLGALVIGLGHAVSDDRLMDAAWGLDPPPTARGSIQSHISRLRRHLGASAIERHDHSYTLNLDLEQVDAGAFERLYRAADQVLPTDPARASDLCHQALDLWRGPPFGELADADFARPEAVRLEEVRIDAMEIFLEATIATGHPGMVVASLQAAVTDHPYREKLWYLLMRALAQEGRRVEALRAFQSAKATLGETGLEPAIDLRQLEQQIYNEEDVVRAHLSQ